MNEIYNNTDSRRVYLVIGLMGVGKSSFVKKITNQQKIQINHTRIPVNSGCLIVEQNDFQIIDTPGINDNSESRYSILLQIVKFLEDNHINQKRIFLICVSDTDLNQLKLIQEFSYTYFLYYLFKLEGIKHSQVEILMREYIQSCGLLNLSESGLHLIQEGLAEMRKKIFRERVMASNYFQYFMNYHIHLRTKFDTTPIGNLREYNQNLSHHYKKQIWSMRNEENRFYSYQEYIQNQEKLLWNKITNIIKMQDDNIQQREENEEIVYILLLGKCQVGKSTLIEQITGIKGIRGDGKKSETSICQIYTIHHSNITYKFIDTPGYEGTEANQTQFHSLKIIADFLFRNHIKEFKILFLQNPKTDVRDTSSQILSQLYIFIQKILDQDVSFIDIKYLIGLIQDNSSSNLNTLLSSKILQVFRAEIGDEQRSEEDLQQQGLTTVEFYCNYYTNNGVYQEVNLVDDKVQKDTLFNFINKMEFVCLEDKILFKIQKTLRSQIISDKQTYLTVQMCIMDQYIKLYNLIHTIKESTFNSNCNDDVKEMQSNQLNIQKDLDSKLYRVVGNFFSDRDIQQKLNVYKKNLLRISHNLDIQSLNYDVKKHFLLINYNPILYEVGANNMKDTFFSRKQMYFSVLNHRLDKFINFENPQHIQKLERLAEIKIVQEITQQQHFQEQYSYFNQHNQIHQEISEAEQLSQYFNIFYASGAQMYRSATYLSKVFEAGQSLAKSGKLIDKIGKSLKNLNFVGSVLNVTLSALSLGVDIYSYTNGKICKNQFAINSSFNLSSSVLSLLSISLIPGLGWMIGGIIGGMAIFTYAFTQFYFTSYTTFNKTISRCIKPIVEDSLPNQALLQFQFSDFLNKTFQFSHYSQLAETQGYEMFRQLESKNYEQQSQKIILNRLFKNNNSSNLIDKISQDIVTKYISNQFFSEIQQKTNETNSDYFMRIGKEIQFNSEIIHTYYNRYCEEQKKVIKKYYESLLKVIKKYQKLMKKNPEQSNNQSIIENKDLQKINNYNEEIKNFKSRIVDGSRDNFYKNQTELGNGYFRKDNRFPILVNSYCNLMELKTNYIYNQPIISDLEKDRIEKKFKVKQNGGDLKCFQQGYDEEELINQLNLLCMSEKYINFRYFQKIKGEILPNFTSVAQHENLECQFDFQIDLHDLSLNAINYKKFKENIDQKLVKQRFHLNPEIENRFRQFYDSVEFLQNYFNKSSA